MFSETAITASLPTKLFQDICDGLCVLRVEHTYILHCVVEKKQNKKNLLWKRTSGRSEVDYDVLYEYHMKKRLPLRLMQYGTIGIEFRFFLKKSLLFFIVYSIFVKF